MNIQLKNILELAALILSIVNALILIWNFSRDRAILMVSPVHPEVYQWWFRLPEGEFEGKSTRGYGFLLYMDISNKGLRKVTLKSWHLFIKTQAQRALQELKPISIPEPSAKLGEAGTKVFAVIGQAGPYFQGETVIDAGCSISGWSYYMANYYGDEKWNPVIKDGKIRGVFVVQDIFGGKAKTEISFSEREFESIKGMISGIETIR